MKKKLEKEFLNLLDNHQNLIHKVCRIYTTDHQLHQDLFQEISIQLWKAYPQFRGESKFSTWAYRVALNTAITLFRKRKNDIQISDVEFASYGFQYTEYDDTQELQLRQMYAAIQQLNDIEKALIFLYLEDKDYTEIADTLGITEVNARVRMNRIKTKLKQLISNQ